MSRALFVFVLCLVAFAAVAQAQGGYTRWGNASGLLQTAADRAADADAALQSYLNAKTIAEGRIADDNDATQAAADASGVLGDAQGALDTANQHATTANMQKQQADQNVSDLRAAYDAAVAALKRDEAAANDVFEKLRQNIQALIDEATANGAPSTTLALLETLNKLDAKVLPQALTQVSASQLVDADRWNGLNQILDGVRQAQQIVSADIAAVAKANADLNAAIQAQSQANNVKSAADAALLAAQQAFASASDSNTAALNAAATAHAKAEVAISARDDAWAVYVAARDAAIAAYKQADEVMEGIVVNDPAGADAPAGWTGNTAATWNGANTANTAPQGFTQVKSSTTTATKKNSQAFLAKLSALLNNNQH